MTEEYLRGVRSFVKREGKLSLRVQRVWDEFAGRFVIDDWQNAVDYLADISNSASVDKYNRIVLEIGSGQGNQLVESAKNNPDTLFIGLEVYRTGVAHTLLLARNAVRDSEDTDANIAFRSSDTILPNFKMLMCDAAKVLRELKLRNITAIFDEVWTFFPDPWPKKRHHKRRLVQNEFRELVVDALKTAGVWRLATDWEDYAIHMQTILQLEPTQRFTGRVLTNFEKKGMDAGREIFDFEYRKH